MKFKLNRKTLSKPLIFLRKCKKISMKDMKISTKLMVYFLTVLIIVGAIAGVGVFGLYNLKTSAEKLYESSALSLRYMGSIQTSIYSMRAHVKDALINAADPEKVKQAREEYDAALTEYQKSEQLFYDMVAGTEIEEKLALAKSTFTGGFQPACKMIFSYLDFGSLGVATSTEANVAGGIELVTDLYDETMDYVVQLAEQENQANNNLAGQLYFLLALISVIGAAIVFLLGMLIKKYTDKPAREMAKAAQSLAEGKLDIEIKYESKDEIGQLALSLKSAASTLKSYIGDISEHLTVMAEGNMDSSITQDYIGDFSPIKESIIKISESFNTLLTQIKHTAEQVNNGAEQVSSGAQALAQGATEQASAIEELSASITEISEKVKKNNENVSSVTENMQITIQDVASANEKMQEMLSAMNEIGVSSEKISKIIKVIDDIAFQTNMLALNAAVEAARAGDSGRGFAVVADEVRNLAGKSADAAKQTAELIQDSIQKVQEGYKLADATGKASMEVVGKMEKVNVAIKEIDKASFEQAAAIDQVTQGIEQISAVVQTNSATAEQSAAASEELLGQAESLHEEVRKFKLKEAVE